MTDENLNLTVLAALLHDIGKLLERGEIFSEARRDEVYLQSCPDDRAKGYSTHLHAAHTAAFCDWLEERFDCLKNAATKDWKIWCAAHHRNDETGPEASIVRISDRLSSSERDEGAYYQKDIHRRTLLEPVLERVSLEGTPVCEATAYRYPPVRLASDKDSLFPVEGTELALNGMKIGLEKMEDAGGEIANPSNWTHLIAKDSRSIVDAYRKLGEGFLSELETLSAKCPDLAPLDLMVCLATLLERYAANVPSATNVRNPDISLFDHLRTTAAIAQALYLQLKNEGRFQVTMSPDDPAPRWLLVCGDFSGIQRFIYNLTNKGAAKGLRGRSFYVGHFCRICANFILRKLGLAKPALLYNSGGKFFLLVPRFMKDEVLKIRAEINRWLLDKFEGNVFFGIGLSDVNAKMFSLGNMDAAWEKAALDLERDRLGKFREQMVGDKEFFEPRGGFDPTKRCRICGSGRNLKEIERDGEIFPQCAACDEMTILGQIIAETKAVITIWGDDSETEILRNRLGLAKRRVFEIPELNVRYMTVPEECLANLEGAEFDGECAFLNECADKRFADLFLPECAVSFLYLGKWNKSGVQTDDWEFDDFADNVRPGAIKRLGILRMDVDNLGLIFIKGLSFPKRSKNGWGDVIVEGGEATARKMASISRMATLSRQLNNFFSAYLPNLLEEDDRFDRCRIIYAGGDDLFVIGSWDQLPELAETVRSEFRKFCCSNPAFTVSGGLILQKRKYPIYKGAKLAGDAEKAAKEVRPSWKRSKDGLKKDGFSFLGVPMLWEDFEHAVKIKELLEKDMNNNRGLLAFLTRMTATNNALVRSIRLKKGATVPEAWAYIAYASWRWRAAYQLRRRYGTNQNEVETWSDILFGDRFEETKSKLPVYSWLEMPLRWTEFLHRG